MSEENTTFCGIKIIKLLNGQEVIGNIIDSQDIRDWIEIEEPRLINVDIDDKGNIRLGLAPFSMFTTDKIFILNSSCILSVFSSAINLEQVYRQQTSGIVLASSSDLQKLSEI